MRKILLIATLLAVLSLTACSNRQAYYPTATESEEPAIYFTTTVRIHENMPEFTFIRTIEGYVSPYNEHLAGQYVSITILDNYGNFVQEIDGITQGGNASWMTADYDFFQLQFMDINFDGYLDMKLTRAINHGTAGGAWHYVWLWNSAINQFELNLQLMDLACMANLQTCNDTQQVSIGRRSGPQHWTVEYFRYNYGKFILYTTKVECFNFCKENARWQWKITHTNAITGKVTVDKIPAERSGESSTSTPDMTSVKEIDNPNSREPYLIRMDAWRQNEWVYGYNEYLVNITVFTFRGFIVQEITDIRASYHLQFGNWVRIDPDNPLNFHIADYNGDGYMDMGLRISPGGSMMNDPHYIWLWDEALEKFVRNAALERISDEGSIWWDDDSWLGSGNIHSHTRGAAEHDVWSSFEFMDGYLVHVQSRERKFIYDGGEPYFRITVTDYINGTECITIEPFN